MFGKKKEKQAFINLVSGLPLQANVAVSIKLTSNGLEFLEPVSKQAFTIAFEKITNMKSYTETEIEKIVEQSAPGMIIGAAAFGLLGAMIGGRVRTKEKKILRYFLVIDYISDEPKQIVFDSSKDYFNTRAILDEFQSLRQSNDLALPIEL